MAGHLHKESVWRKYGIKVDKTRPVRVPNSHN